MTVPPPQVLQMQTFDSVWNFDNLFTDIASNHHGAERLWNMHGAYIH